MTLVFQRTKKRNAPLLRNIPSVLTWAHPLPKNGIGAHATKRRCRIYNCSSWAATLKDRKGKATYEWFTTKTIKTGETRLPMGSHKVVSTQAVRQSDLCLRLWQEVFLLPDKELALRAGGGRVLPPASLQPVFKGKEYGIAKSSHVHYQDGQIQSP